MQIVLITRIASSDSVIENVIIQSPLTPKYVLNPLLDKRYIFHRNNTQLPYLKFKFSMENWNIYIYV